MAESMKDYRKKNWKESMKNNRKKAIILTGTVISVDEKEDNT